MHAVSYTVEYDANSVAWLVPVDNPSYRIALTHGTMLNASVIHVDRYQDPPCGGCQRMLPILDGLGICEDCATGEVSIAELEARGVAFAKIPAGDQTLYVAKLPRPGGTP